jgi:hypothetical protein
MYNIDMQGLAAASDPRMEEVDYKEYAFRSLVMRLS